MSTLTSRQHAVVREVRRVARGDAALALVDGWHLLTEALAAGLAIETVAVAEDARWADAESSLARAAAAGARVLRVSASVMAALSPVRTPSGVVALVRRRPAAIEALVTPAPALVLVGVGIQDPGNVGAAIRAAEAGGATGAVFTGASADPWGWKALRAAMGSTFRLPVGAGVAPSEACHMLASLGLTVVAALPRTGIPMGDVDFRRPVALLLGGEGPGLAPDLLALADAGVSIPMRAPVESLNVAVATGLLVYEARRQRQDGS